MKQVHYFGGWVGGANPFGAKMLQTDKHTGLVVHKSVQNPTDRQTDRLTDRQTDRQRDRQKYDSAFLILSLPANTLSCDVIKINILDFSLFHYLFTFPCTLFDLGHLVFYLFSPLVRIFGKIGFYLFGRPVLV